MPNRNQTAPTLELVADQPETTTEPPFEAVEVVEAQPEPIPAPDMPPGPKVMVAFSYVRVDGFRDIGRTFIAGLTDIRTRKQVEQAEQAIIQQLQGTIHSATIITWKRLED